MIENTQQKERPGYEIFQKKKEEEKTEGRENTGIESIVYLTKNKNKN